MNRQQRRAVQRKEIRVPMVRIGMLTIPEAEVMAEALDAYALKVEEDSDFTLTEEQVWAVGRARAMRDAVQAGIDGRPWLDERAERTP